jgi:hypothetical protein
MSIRNEENNPLYNKSICPCCGQPCLVVHQEQGVQLPEYGALSRICPVPLEMLELAEEIASDFGVEHIDRWQLEPILQGVLYVDRRRRFQTSGV